MANFGFVIFYVIYMFSKRPYIENYYIFLVWCIENTNNITFQFFYLKFDNWTYSSVRIHNQRDIHSIQVKQRKSRRVQNYCQARYRLSLRASYLSFTCINFIRNCSLKNNPFTSGPYRTVHFLHSVHTPKWKTQRRRLALFANSSLARVICPL